MELSVVIVNYNTRHVLPRMMSALERALEGVDAQIVVIDNASRDGSAGFVAQTWPGVTLVANEVNVGFGRANNQALPMLRGEFMLLLNPDAYVESDSIRNMLQFMRDHEKCGIAGARLTEADGSSVGCCARGFPTPWNVFLLRTGLDRIFRNARMVDDPHWDATRNAECDWVIGAFLMIRRSVIDEVGLFDPRFFLYSEEVDLCRKVKTAGWTVGYCASSIAVHAGGESAQSEGKLSANGGQLSKLQLESELLYYRKHYGIPGLLASMFLGLTADAIVAAKNLVRLRRFNDAFAWTRSALPLFLKTRLGTIPTR